MLNISPDMVKPKNNKPLKPYPTLGRKNCIQICAITGVFQMAHTLQNYFDSATLDGFPRMITLFYGRARVYLSLEFD